MSYAPPPPLGSDPRSLAAAALERHRDLIFRRFASLCACAAFLVLLLLGSVLVAVFAIRTGFAGLGVALVMALVMVAVAAGAIVQMHSQATNRPFADLREARSNSHRTPLSASLLFGGVTLGALVMGLLEAPGHPWVGLLAGVLGAVVIAPATVPFMLTRLQRGAIADRYLAQHPEQVGVINALATYPDAPRQLPTWLAQWRPGTPVEPFGVAPPSPAWPRYGAPDRPAASNAPAPPPAQPW